MHCQFQLPRREVAQRVARSPLIPAHCISVYFSGIFSGTRVPDIFRTTTADSLRFASDANK